MFYSLCLSSYLYQLFYALIQIQIFFTSEPVQVLIRYHNFESYLPEEGFTIVHLIGFVSYTWQYFFGPKKLSTISDFVMCIGFAYTALVYNNPNMWPSFVFFLIPFIPEFVIEFFIFPVYPMFDLPFVEWEQLLLGKPL